MPSTTDTSSLGARRCAGRFVKAQGAGQLPLSCGKRAAHGAVIYHQISGARGGPVFCVPPGSCGQVEGALVRHRRERVRAAVLADVGIALATEWMLAQIADGTVQVALRQWELPGIDLWAILPAGRAPRFVSFVQKLMHEPRGAEDTLGAIDNSPGESSAPSSNTNPIRIGRSGSLNMRS
jgi:DNA-binding transcriptional LysR family regulator